MGIGSRPQMIGGRHTPVPNLDLSFTPLVSIRGVGLPKTRPSVSRHQSPGSRTPLGRTLGPRRTGIFSGPLLPDERTCRPGDPCTSRSGYPRARGGNPVRSRRSPPWPPVFPGPVPTCRGRPRVSDGLVFSRTGSRVESHERTSVCPVSPRLSHHSPATCEGDRRTWPGSATVPLSGWYSATRL